MYIYIQEITEQTNIEAQLKKEATNKQAKNWKLPQSHIVIFSYSGCCVSVHQMVDATRLSTSLINVYWLKSRRQIHR